MNFIIGLIIVSVVAVLVIRRVKPELYERIKNSITTWL